MTVAVVPAGEAAAMVVMGHRVDLAVNQAVLDLDRRLSSMPIAGVTETAPALTTLLIRFDPLLTTLAGVEAAVHAALADTQDIGTDEVRRWRLPAAYGGEHGPDLSTVAAHLGVDDDGAVSAHASLDLRVLMLGFAPGFAYLGLAPEPWDLPRRPAVRPAVPPGSLLVAVRQTAVGATTVPTGWHVIGRTPAPLFSPAAPDPFLLRPGDRVTFEPVDPPAFSQLAAQARAGQAVARLDAG